MPLRKDNDLLDHILWFDSRIPYQIDYFDLLQPRRAVSHNSRFRSGLFRSAKCGRDIQYESALERRFAELLEQHEQVRFYWEQPVKIPYWRGRRKLFYTPDYGIYLDSGHVVLVEVKELSEMLDYRVQQKTEALMAFCAERGFGMLLTDGRHTPRDLLAGRVNRRLERALLKALDDHHPLRHGECKTLLERCGATPSELHKAVIRHRLRFRSFPMTTAPDNDCAIFRRVFFDREKYEEVIGEILPSFLHRDDVDPTLS